MHLKINYAFRKNQFSNNSIDIQLKIIFLYIQAIKHNIKSQTCIKYFSKTQIYVI